MRTITSTDHMMLSAAAKSLPLELRARILPEEKLEACLLLGDENAVAALIRDEKPGMMSERCKYLYQQAPTRNARFAKELQELYGGKCQICGWSPKEQYGYLLCQGHHVHWLSRGGDDTLENMMLVCPNHHVAIHRSDAPFDYADSSFDFGTRREALLLNSHFPIS